MKKTLCIVLSLLFVALAFAGCGKDEKKEEDDKLAITILYEQDDSMINNYSLLAVNPDAPFVDADGNAVTDVKINTVQRREKLKSCDGSETVLVDDREDTIRDWVKKGGTGILHVSAEETLKKMEELGLL